MDARRGTEGCALEWAPICRDDASAPTLDRTKAFAIPAEAVLTLHGVSCNNHFAHRFVFDPPKRRKRICVVLFCWSKTMAERIAEQQLPVLVDMKKWWTPEMNEITPDA